MRFESGTQTISWFQKEYREGTITIRPPFQRKPVWAARQKCYLIESILLGLLFDENLRAIQRLLPNIKETRWSNKTDFYTLFVALAFAQRPLAMTTSTVKHARTALE